MLYFCDETSHKGDEFMAVGGIAVNVAAADRIEASIRDIRKRMNRTSEVKWSNLKARRDNVQKAFVELLHYLVNENQVHFHIRFQRMEDWDHARSGARKRIDTVSKAYYNLIVHRPIAMYGHRCDLHIRPDGGECTARLHEFRPAMNNEARRRWQFDNPVRSVHVRDSAGSELLQLLDVTLGGLAAIRNGRHLRADISSAKRDLAIHIHELWGRQDLARSTSKDTRRFNVWNARPGDSH